MSETQTRADRMRKLKEQSHECGVDLLAAGAAIPFVLTYQGKQFYCEEDALQRAEFLAILFGGNSVKETGEARQ